MHADTSSFAFALATDKRANGRFLKITRLKPEPWALVAQAFPATGLAGKVIRLAVSVNAEELEGGAGPMILLQDQSGATAGDRQVLVERQQGWRRVTAELLVKPGTTRVEFGLLMQGGGSAGFDDVVAEILPAANP